MIIRAAQRLHRWNDKRRLEPRRFPKHTEYKTSVQTIRSTNGNLTHLSSGSIAERSLDKTSINKLIGI